MGLDLHMHSFYSDGSLPPEKIVDTAIEVGLDAIAITDHDNVLAYGHAKTHAEQRAKELNQTALEIIPGIEVNTVINQEEVHVLGYFMDSSCKNIQDMIAYQQHARVEQLTKIVEKLRTEAKINICMEDITSLAQENGSVGRPHMAKAIVNTGGASNLIEAYKKYINNKAPTYIKRKTVSPHEAVETIYEAGGIPVIAHPCDLENPETLIVELMNYGLRGIEAYHRKHSPAMIEYFSSIAERYKLIITGGSDCHGPKPNGQLLLGKNHVPDWVLTELKKEKNRLKLASS